MREQRNRLVGVAIGADLANIHAVADELNAVFKYGAEAKPAVAAAVLETEDARAAGGENLVPQQALRPFAQPRVGAVESDDRVAGIVHDADAAVHRVRFSSRAEDQR